LADLFEALKTEFDLVLFDLPAVSLPHFPFRLAGILDGTLWIVEAERVWPEVALRTKELLTRANVQLLGTVLNRTRRYLPSWMDGRG
jgi:polysaccharide biosynthesis transport protein